MTEFTGGFDFSCSFAAGFLLHSPTMSKTKHVKSKTKAPRTLATGGGNATASGVNFQQSFGALLGVWMLAETPIDPRLQLGNATVTSIRMETEAPLDDAFATTSNGGIICSQAKNTLSMSNILASEFGKTVDQIVRQWRLCHYGAGDLGWNRPLDQNKDRLVIVVGPGSPVTTRVNLAKGLEARRQPGAPVLTAAETKALNQFDTCVRLAWAASSPGELLTEDIQRSISRLTYIYTIDPEGADRAAWIATLAPVFDKAADAPTGFNLLERIAGDLMSGRRGRTLPTLRADLMARGARLAARPEFCKDVAALTTYSLQTEQILASLEVVEAETGVPVGITRYCQAAVNAAALGGNLLLIGEPGAGKSAVINALSRALRKQGHDVVQLAVDRFSVESLEGLSRALELEHELPAVLSAWDGLERAFLLIDALDASRGGSGEAAFKRLIEAIVELNGRWTIVASIRTFDLRLGHNFRALFKGTPPDKTLQDDGLANVRHIQIPPWSEAEFAEILARAPRLADVLKHSSARLCELAMVPFNTRLLANLVATGAVSQDFNLIDSQVSLLNLYWDRRVRGHGVAAEICLRIVVEEMVATRALRAQRLKVATANPNILDTLTGEGVLVVTNGERSVQFRHHVLFDYVASRVFLDPDAVITGSATFPKTEGLGLVLAPAMGFLLQSLWTEGVDHKRFWTAVSNLLGVRDCDPIIRSVAARIAAELPVTAEDVEAFAAMINAGSPTTIAALPHVAGAVAVRMEDESGVALAPWVHLELRLSTKPADIAGVLRMMAFMLIDRVKEPALRADLGSAVRALLAYGYTLEESQILATPGIGFVADTLATDVEASVALLRQALSKDRFDRFAPQEVPALARKIELIAPISPRFAAEVYECAFAGQVTEDRQTSLSGSRILNLTSNARQDFQLAQWSLKEYFPHFLVASPVEATEALLLAIEGYVARAHPLSEDLEELSITVEEAVARLQPDYSHIWAHDPDPDHPDEAEKLLSQFLTWLKTGDETSVLAAVNFMLSRCRLAVFWSRLFMAGATRGGALAQRLRAYAVHSSFLITHDTRKDAIDLLALQYHEISEAERRAIETELLEWSFSEYINPEAAKESFLQRLFGTIGMDSLATEAARAVVASMPESGATNNRLVSISVGYADNSDDYRWLNQEAKANPAIHEAIADLDLVREQLRLEVGDNEPPVDPDAALDALGRLGRRLTNGAISDRNLLHRAEGLFAQGVHKLINSDHIGASTLPETVTQLVEWIEVASRFDNPEVDSDTEKKFEEFRSWGSPSARIEAAEAALDLCLKRPEVYLGLKSLIDRTLSDPHPAVRMNAAVHLVRIWEIDREGFWTRATRFVETETNRSVLDSFICSTLDRVQWDDAAREVADLVLPLIKRFSASDSHNNSIRQHINQLTLQFWFRFGFEDAAEHVRAWFAQAVDNAEEVGVAIQWLRPAFTVGLRTEDKTEFAAQRPLALKLLAQAVMQAGQALDHYETLSAPDEADTARARQALRIIDTACQQLYFSTGSFQDGDRNPAPLMMKSAAIFVHETAPILRQIGKYGGPHTIYYLIQLLEQLIVADAGGVFDLISTAVLQGGQQTGYQFEHMGAELIVKLVGRFLADHKEIFDGPHRRTALVDTLEVFVNAGWPSVRRLFYRLPELLY
ncbi:ATP-binding protein [Methylobacterium nonmethylotrophicum]|uniref:ATP-binding protein n=1 Tax=Methylobacterium nonmethylotrophicum TaxID=1141884 RepID=A0A4Z0NEB9_9HYPH|nr:ATP-binding protein [Methylobacterium nonmethylotrophicum]TGD94579.1 ATP-binding protein [Methylobacterium nonmethylotrophicum]